MKIPAKMLPFLWHFVKKQPWAFAIILFTALIWSFNEVFFPYFIKLIINILANFQGDRHQIYLVLWIPVGALIICWVLMDIAMRTQGILLIYTFPRFRASIRDAVFNYIKEHSHSYFSNHFVGSIAQKLSSLPTSCQNVVEIIVFTFSSIIVGFLIACFLMYIIQPIFSVILLIWFCLHMSLVFIFLRRGNQHWEKHSKSVATLNGKMIDSITNIMNIRLFARGQYERTHIIQQAQTDEIKKAHKALWSIEIMRLCQGLIGLGLIFSMIFVLIYGWIHHWVTLGDFSLIGMLSFWVLGMVWYMSYQIGLFVREKSSINEALTLISEQHEIVDAPHATYLQVTKGEIYFKEVTFAYPQGESVFEALTLHIQAGEKVGLVGFSGSGKSTFVNLILRLFDLRSGSIYIDGQDIATVTLVSLYEAIAMIPQEPSLFHRTLMENIRYGNLSATDLEVIQAAKLAHCHEYIQQLPESYQSLVGERGVKLSGGQRQRIAIARVFLKKAAILIMDEATSALDSVTEKAIQESLKHLMQNKTALVIAHRLSTLANMDRILVFDKGAIIEQGTLKDLLKKEGHFSYLWKMQSHGFLPEKDNH